MVSHNKRRCNPATNEASRVATPASKQKRVRLVTIRFFFLVDNATLSYDVTFIGERARCRLATQASKQQSRACNN